MDEVVMVKKEIELPKELAEVVDSVGELFVVVKQALADGFQAGQDLPVIVSSVLAKAMTDIDGAQKIPAEVKHDPAKLALLTGLLAEKIMHALIK